MTNTAHISLSSARRAMRNLAFSFLSLGCRLVGNVIVFFIIARLPTINTADFGQITYAVALTSIVVLFAQFGLQPFLVREIAANPALLHHYTRSVFALRLLLTALGVAIMLCYLQRIDMTDQGRVVFYLMSAALFVGSFSVDLQSIFQSQERMSLEFVGIVVENVLLLALSFAAFVINANVIQVSCIFLAAKSVALLINYVICGKTVIWLYPRFDIHRWRKILSEALPFALTAVLAAGIVQIDSVMIRELSRSDGESAVGVYQAAVRLFLIPMLLPEIILKVFLPQLSRLHSAHGVGLVKDVSRINNILLTLGLLTGVVTLFRGPDLIMTFYGEKYGNAGPILQVLGFSVMLRFGAAYNLYFTIRGRVWLRVAAACITLAVVIGLNYFLIPKYGSLGAAYASVIAHVIYWIPFLVALFLAEGTINLGWNIARSGCAALLLAAFLWATSSFGVLYMLPVYATFIALAVLTSMTHGDRTTLLRHLWPQCT